MRTRDNLHMIECMPTKYLDSIGRLTTTQRIASPVKVPGNSKHPFGRAKLIGPVIPLLYHFGRHGIDLCGSSAPSTAFSPGCRIYLPSHALDIARILFILTKLDMASLCLIIRERGTISLRVDIVVQ